METAETLSPVDARRRPRLGRIRAGLLALCVPLLSLVIVFTTPSTARALDPGATKVIQGALKSPPAQIIRWTPAGRAITFGAGLAMLAYETRDMWLPTVKDWLNPEGQMPTNPGSEDWDFPQAKCSGGSELTFDNAQEAVASGDFSCVLANAEGDYSPGWTIRWESQCWNPTTGAVGSMQNRGQTSVPENDATSFKIANTLRVTASLDVHSPPLCGSTPGWVPLAVKAVTMSANIKFLPVLRWQSDFPEETVSSQTNIECVNADTRAVVGTVTANMTGHGGINVPSCSKSYPGSIPWSGTVDVTNPAGTTPVGTFTTDSDLYEEWRDCFGPTGVICKTEVYVDGQRCVIGRDVCVIWWRINRGEPERVECRFGTHVVGIDQCMPLKQAYGTGTKLETATQVETLLNPDFDVDAPPAPNPSSSPTPSPSASPTPNPTPTPSSPPTTGPNPEVPAPAPPTPETNPDSRSCYGDAWGWNPIDWVYIPVKCALKWAFVPKTSVQVRTQRIGTAYDLKFPFTVPAMVGGMGGSVGGGCPDWNVIVEADTWDAVCESSFTQAIRGARGWLTGGMLAAAFWPLVRGLFFASVPVIKPTPTDPK